jgi:phage/plasmid-associated DNA primase
MPCKTDSLNNLAPLSKGIYQLGVNTVISTTPKENKKGSSCESSRSVLDNILAQNLEKMDAGKAITAMVDRSNTKLNGLKIIAEKSLYRAKRGN